MIANCMKPAAAILAAILLGLPSTDARAEEAYISAGWGYVSYRPGIAGLSGPRNAWGMTGHNAAAPSGDWRYPPAYFPRRPPLAPQLAKVIDIHDNLAAGFLAAPDPCSHEAGVCVIRGGR